MLCARLFAAMLVSVYAQKHLTLFIVASSVDLSMGHKGVFDDSKWGQILGCIFFEKKTSNTKSHWTTWSPSQELSPPLRQQHQNLKI